MAWSQAVLQNTGEITCKSQASINYSLGPNPREHLSLSHHWNRNFTYLHFISAPGHSFYCCVDSDILVLPIFSLTCQSTPHHLQPLFQHCNWDCRCHHLISKHLCVAQLEIQECPSTFHSWYWKEKQDTLQSTHLFSYGKNWCWLKLVLTSLENSTSINRTIHKFEVQYSLKAFAEDKHSSVILFLNWGSPQMVLLCMTRRPNTTAGVCLCVVF